LAALKPGIATLEYEQVRSALRELLEELPQAHEVSSVLEHMSKIQADEAASAPVFDWEKQERRLHIIDPYFAFFLRWATPSASGN
jgi:Tfp pilus assembly protein PilO